MKKAGAMWVTDDEFFFDKFFAETVDRFTPEPVEEALKHVRVGGGRTAIDGGASYGAISRQIRDRFARVLAFEPNEAVYECLLRNTAEFAQIRCRLAALGDAPRGVSVGIAPENRHHAGTPSAWYCCNTGCVQVLGDGTVPMITIDGLALDDLDLLKLDVEGMEFAALRGAEATLRRCRPVVLIEDCGHGARYGLKGDECRAFLTGLGYQVAYQGPYGDFVYVSTGG